MDTRRVPTSFTFGYFADAPEMPLAAIWYQGSTPIPQIHLNAVWYPINAIDRHGIR